MRGRCRQEDSGAAAVEFALVVIPVLVVLFGLIQYGMYFYSAQTGSSAVNSAVRQLSVGNCQATNAVRDYVDRQLGAAKTDTHASVTSVWADADGNSVANASAAGVGGSVKLTISFHSINMNFPFVPFLSDAVVERTAQARVEDTTDQGCPS